MNDGLRSALSVRLLALADDELILGHRNSEWCGHAPILEEDIAFANIALDEIGHAVFWYTILAELNDKDPEKYPDELVYERFASHYRCVPLVTLPKGDWAFSMTRQYLFDTYEAELLAGLADSKFEPFRDAAAKFRKEEVYHLRHTTAWVRRLGLGTKESHHRMQNALDGLWGYALQLFEPVTGQPRLAELGYFPDANTLKDSWLDRVTPQLEDAGLVVPAEYAMPELSRDFPAPYLFEILEELQKVARLDPNAEW